MKPGNLILLLSCMTCVAQAPDAAVTRQMHEALATAQRGDERQSLVQVTELLHQHPDFVPALKLEGMLLEDLGQGSKSLDAYRRALQLAPKDAELLLTVGTADLVAGRTAEALPLLERHTRLVPKDDEGLYYLAQAYHLGGQDDRALETIKQAAQLAPGSGPIAQKYGELLCSTADYDEAGRWLLKAQQLDGTLPRLAFDLGVASYGSENLDQAVTYAQQEALQRPNDSANLMLLASAEVKLSRWQEAESALDGAAALKPLDAPALVLYGHAAYELKQYPAAVEALHKALAQDPTQLLAHFYLAKAYQGLGEKDEAQHEGALHREMMQHLAFNLPKAEQQRADALAEAAKQALAAGHEEKALALFAADSLNSGAGTAWVSLASVYLSLGENEHANRAIAKALALDPKTRSAHLYLGIAALQAGDLTMAAREFEAELSVDANSSLAQGELGEVRYRQGRFDEAAELIGKSKTTNPTLLYLLCDSYFHLGNVPKATLTAESAAAYGHNQREFLAALGRLLAANNQPALAAKVADERQKR